MQYLIRILVALVGLYGVFTVQNASLFETEDISKYFSIRVFPTKYSGELRNWCDSLYDGYITDCAYCAKVIFDAF